MKYFLQFYFIFFFNHAFAEGQIQGKSTPLLAMMELSI